MQDRLFGKKIRYRSPHFIIDEIKSYRRIWERFSPLKTMGIPFIVMFIDDMFLSKPEWVHSFCDAAEQSGETFWWGCQARVDNLQEDLLKRMIDAGCRNIAFGVESGSQRVLDFLRKDIRPEDTLRAFEICHRLNISTHAYVIIGSPEETVEDLQATWELLKQLEPTTCYVARATPLPGSHLYDYAIEKGILTGSTFDENFDYYYTRAPMRLTWLTPEHLDEFEEKVRALFPHMPGLRK
jgi:radical SAM superfamily enzyme YgiQ (UPF0313 family)